MYQLAYKLRALNMSTKFKLPLLLFFCLLEFVKHFDVTDYLICIFFFLRTLFVFSIYELCPPHIPHEWGDTLWANPTSIELSTGQKLLKHPEGRANSCAMTAHLYLTQIYLPMTQFRLMTRFQNYTLKEIPHNPEIEMT